MKNHSISLLLPLAIDSDAEKIAVTRFQVFSLSLSLSPRLINGAKVSTLFWYRISRLVVQLYQDVIKKMKERGNNYEKIIKSFSREKENCMVVFAYAVFLN